MKFIKDLFISILCLFAFIAVFMGAVLQDSYRKYPPTELERAEHPMLVKFLVGGE